MGNSNVTATPSGKTQETAIPEENTTAKKTGFSFKVKKHVSLTTLKIQIDVPFYIRPEGKIYQGKELKHPSAQDAKTGKKREPAFLMQVTNLETGERCNLVLNQVLRDTLKDEYPDDGYIGKFFEVVKKEKASGKSYNNFVVTEIEPE